MSFVALVLAGSRGGTDPAARHAGVSDKALLVIAGQTMLERVVDALRRAGAARILVAASSEAVADHARALGAETIAAAAGPSDSAGLGLAALGAPLLVTTADHALLRPEWIARIMTGLAPDADVGVLLARREAVEAAAPGTRRTYLRFADGAWSGCNLFHLATPRAAAAIELWRSVERDRKRPWRIVRRLGPLLLLRYLAGRLTLAEALARLGSRGGFRAMVVESPDGLAAVDVDTAEDVELVRRIATGINPGSASGSGSSAPPPAG